VGSRWPLEGPRVSAMVVDTGAAARIDDYAELSGAIASAVIGSGRGPTVGAPLSVDGDVWGVVTVSARAGEHLRADMEERLSEFTELLALAVANTECHDHGQRRVRRQA